MKILTLINDVADLAARQTTTLLVNAAARKHDSWMAGVDDLFMDDHTLCVAAAAASETDQEALAAALPQRRKEVHELTSFQLVLVRTNPARDAAPEGVHHGALQFLRVAADLGVPVVNDPSGLWRASTKPYLAELPDEVVAPCLVSRDVDAIEAWVKRHGGPVVVKPARGTRGQDVFVVRPPELANLRTLVDVVRRDGYVMVQGFVPGAEAGDVRVFLVDGHILEMDGHAAAVARIPRPGDFRSNVHAGGTPARAVVDDGVRRAVELIGGRLRRDGLFIVGADFIGTTIIELNVFSPGGLGNASEHSGCDFAGEVITRLEAYLARPRRPPPSNAGIASVSELEP